MQKLAIAKKIMNKHNETPRGTFNNSDTYTENIPNATYNIPQNIVEGTSEPTYNIPPVNEKPSLTTNQPPSEDAIKKSKLPDEIKKLMLENPIRQPQMNGPVLSDEVIAGATRLMGTNKKTINESQNNPQKTSVSEDLKQIIKETVREVIKEELQKTGMITENTQKTNEQLTLRVGNHLFEGKILKIKKVK